MIIANNIPALTITNILDRHNFETSKSMEKLSSGFRINKSGDDPAGLAISEKMKAQTRGLRMAGRNTQDAISLVQTAEGALGEMHSILQRMRELAVQSSNGTNTDMDREYINNEVQQLKDEIDRISEHTNFNTIKLLNGNLSEYGIPRGIQIPEPEPKGPYPMSVKTKSDIADRRREEIDFSTVIDGSIITIEGVSFEFDIDGIKNNTSSATVDIKGVSDSEKINKFIEAFDRETISSDYFIFGFPSGTSGSSKINIMDIRRIVRNGTNINISYTDSPLINIKEKKKEVKDFDMGLGKLIFQTGPSEGSTITLNINSMSTKKLGINDVVVVTSDKASSAITSVDKAISIVSSTRANLGAVQNRLEHTLKNLAVSEENLTASNSRILDCDMAKEIVELVKDNILTKVAQSVLAQTNDIPRNVLKLLI